MINAIEAIITWLKIEPTLDADIADRVAIVHRFGEVGGWTKGQKAIAVQFDAGTPNLYLDWRKPRCEVRIFGPDVYSQHLIYSKIEQLVVTSNRVVVQTTQGKALITELEIAAMPSLLYDVDLQQQTLIFFLTANVAVDDVP